MKYLAVFLLAGCAFAFPASQPSKGNTTTCSAAQNAMKSMLVGGIQANLDIQAQELKGVKTLQSLVNANKTGKAFNGTSNFQSEQSTVLVIQQKGIDIRANNQKLASSLSSPASKGLAVVAQAQVTEMMQVKGLKGGGDADKKTLETLVKEVMDGTKQNQMNLQMAESQCGK